MQLAEAQQQKINTIIKKKKIQINFNFLVNFTNY